MDWTKEEISKIENKTCKLLTMHKVLHPKDDAHMLYIKRKGGKRLISIECVEDAIAALQHYVQNSQERLSSAAWRSSGEQEVTESLLILVFYALLA